MLQTSSKKQSVNWNELKQSSLDTGSHMDRIRAYHRGWDESGRGRLGAGGGHTNDTLYSTQNFCTFKSKDYLSVLAEWKSWLSHVVLVQCTFDSISSNKDKETTELNMHPVLNGKNNVFYLKKMWKHRKVQWRKKKEKRGGGGGGKKPPPKKTTLFTWYIFFSQLISTFFSVHSAFNTYSTMQFFLIKFYKYFIY